MKISFRTKKFLKRMFSISVILHQPKKKIFKQSKRVSLWGRLKTTSKRAGEKEANDVYLRAWPDVRAVKVISRRSAHGGLSDDATCREPVSKYGKRKKFNFEDFKESLILCKCRPRRHVRCL